MNLGRLAAKNESSKRSQLHAVRVTVTRLHILRWS